MSKQSLANKRPPPQPPDKKAQLSEEELERKSHQQVKNALEKRFFQTLEANSRENDELIRGPSPTVSGYMGSPIIPIAEAQSSSRSSLNSSGSTYSNSGSTSRVPSFRSIPENNVTSPITSPRSYIASPPPPPALRIPSANQPFQPSSVYYIQSTDIEVMSTKHGRRVETSVKQISSPVYEPPRGSTSQEDSQEWWLNLLISSGIHVDKAPKYVNYISTHIGFSNFISDAEHYIPYLEESCGLTDEDKIKLRSLLSDPKDHRHKKNLFQRKNVKVEPKPVLKKSPKNKKLTLQNWEGRKSMIGTPFNFQHQVHVDFNFNWTGGEEVEKFFVLEEKLGQGAYGAVYRGKHRESGYIMAIKVIEDMSDSETLKKEIDILRKCQNSNIVCYYGTITVGKHLWILMDYCALGSIRDLIETTERTLTEKQIGFIIKNTLKGLVYLHAQKIIHRDIKAANILLNEQAEVKLADFGVSEQLDAGKSESDEMIGTPLWMAPEVIKKTKYDSKADIWSLGITIIEMGDGLPPHADMNPMRAMQMVPVRPPPTFSEPSKWSSSINTFIAKCLNKKPEERPSSVDLLMEGFIQKAPGPDVLQDQIAECLEIKLQETIEEQNQQHQQTHSSQSPKTAKSHSQTSVFQVDDNMGTMVINDEENNPDLSSTSYISSNDTMIDSQTVMMLLGKDKSSSTSLIPSSKLKKSQFLTNMGTMIVSDECDGEDNNKEEEVKSNNNSLSIIDFSTVSTLISEIVNKNLQSELPKWKEQVLTELKGQESVNQVSNLEEWTKSVVKECISSLEPEIETERETQLKGELESCRSELKTCQQRLLKQEQEIESLRKRLTQFSNLINNKQKPNNSNNSNTNNNKQYHNDSSVASGFQTTKLILDDDSEGDPFGTMVIRD